MNLWLIPVGILLVCIFVCGVFSVTRGVFDAIVGMEMASGIGVLTIAIIAVAVGRPAWFDLALAMGLLSFPSGLLFVALARSDK